MDYVRIIDESGDVAKVDNYLKNVVVMGEIHALIHEGKFYSCSYTDLAVADAGMLQFYVNPSQVAHMRVSFHSGGDSRLQVFEGTTVSAEGTAITPVNRNRMSANTATTAIYRSPTVTSTGTDIYDIFNAGGRKNQASGGSGASFEEFILNPSTTYLFRLSNMAGNTSPMSLLVDFYEL